MTFKDLCEVKDTLAAINRLDAKIRDMTGLNLNQAFALCCLAQNGPLNPTELANHLRISPPSLSRVLRSLEEKNLVDASQDDKDSRQKKIVLGPEGEKISVHLISAEAELFPFIVE